MAAADIVSALFTSVLGRPVDAEGLAYFTDALNRGATPEQVRQALATSPESQANVSKIFTQSLQRAATPSDVQYFTNAIAGGGLLSDVQRDVQASTEAQGLLGTVTPPVTTTPVVPPVTPVVVTPPVTTTPVVTPVTPGGTTDYTSQVNALFRKVFGRDADPTGLAYWSNVFAQGGSAADIEAGLRASAEGKSLVVKPPVVPPVVKPPVGTDYSGQVNALFQKVFGRDADPTGLAYWSNVFAQGGSAADIEAGLRASAEGQTPAVQNFQRGTRTVPFGSQLIGENVQQVAQYARPAAQAGPAMGPPSLQSFLAGTPGAANLSPFQQSLQYQAALPGMIQPFNPADIPATYQQTLSPRPRLDISQTTIPSWLQTAIDAQNKKDGIEVSDLQKFNTANQVTTNSGLGPVTPVVPPVTPGVTPVVPVVPPIVPVVPPTVTGNLAAGGIDPRIIQGYSQIGRAGDKIDMPGAQYWGGLLASGTPIADIYAGMAASPEGLLYAQNQAAKTAAANAAANVGSEF